jgi:hypothetical protein
VKDVLASNLSNLVALLKERDEGVSMQTLIQVEEVDKVLEGHAHLPGASRLRAVYRQYRDAIEAIHWSGEVFVDRDEALAAAEEALTARNAELPVDERVHGEASP